MSKLLNLPIDNIKNIIKFITNDIKIDFINDNNYLCSIILLYFKYLEEKNSILLYYKKDDTTFNKQNYCNINYSNINYSNIIKLINNCEFATFGQPDINKKMHIVNYNKNIRNAYIINKDNFKLSNTLKKKFDLFIYKYIYDLYKTNDNIINDIQYQQYSVNIYTKSGHFKSHIDTPKYKNHIGTLILLLPMKFTGGELIVNNEKCKWKNLDDTNILWTYFSKSIIHSVNEIKSGIRITITFDVIMNKSNQLSNSTSSGFFKLITREGKEDPLLLGHKTLRTKIKEIKRNRKESDERKELKKKLMEKIQKLKNNRS